MTARAPKLNRRSYHVDSMLAAFIAFMVFVVSTTIEREPTHELATGPIIVVMIAGVVGTLRENRALKLCVWWGILFARGVVLTMLLLRALDG